MSADEASPTSGSRPSSAWEPPDVAVLQELLPQYEFYALCGRGGMGAVYHARQVSLDRPVAIKVLPGGIIDDTDAGFVERFRNEARTMGRMNHPGIVNVYDFGKTADELLYFVMEYVEGTDVSEMVLAQGKLPQEHAIAITMHVCDALEYAHKQGVIHRDIKPANILIDYEGKVKVADFGLAKATTGPNTGMTSTDMTMGTPDYVAPEALVIGLEADHRADLYAVGVMLYNMLTGEIPRGRFKMPSQKVGSDPRLDEVINRAMEAERDERYQTAAEIRADLDRILHSPYAPPRPSGHPAPLAASPSFPAAPSRPGPHRPLPSRPPQPEPPPENRPPYLVYALAVAALAVGAFLFVKKPANPPEPGVTIAETTPDTPQPSAASGPTASSSPLAWIPVSWEKEPPAKGQLRDGALLLPAEKSLTLPVPSTRDAAIRLKVRRQGDFPRGASATLRGGGVADHPYCVIGAVRRSGPARMGLVTVLMKSAQDVGIVSMAPCETLAADRDSLIEFAAVGNRLILSIDGQLIATVTTELIMDAGQASISAGPQETEFREIEVLPLDGVNPENYPAFVKLGLTKNLGEVTIPPPAIPSPPPPARDPGPVAASSMPQASPRPSAVSPEVTQRLATLATSFAAAFQRDFTAEPAAGIAPLNALYLKLLQRPLLEAQAAARLNESVALKQEMALIEKNAPIPFTDAADLPDVLKRLRAAYRAQRLKRFELYARYDNTLTSYVAELTRAGRLDDASAVDQERQKVAGAAEVFKPGATGSPSAQVAPVSAQPAGSVSLSRVATDFPKGTSPEASRMILSKGGTVTIEAGGQRREVSVESDLPAGTFHLTSLTIAPGSGQSVEISDKEMASLGSLPRLDTIKLTSTTLSDESFAMLRSLPSLASLVLTDCQSVTDETLARIAFLEHLHWISLESCRQVTSAGIAHLAALKELEKLYLSNLPRVDKNILPAILALSRLQKFSACGCSDVDGAFLEKLAALPVLDTLGVYPDQLLPPTNLSRLKSLSEVRFYRNLDAGGAGLPDGIFDTLATAKALSRVTMRSLEISEPQLQRLAQMRGLRQLVGEALILPPTAFASLKDSSITTISCGDLGELFDDATLQSLVPLKSLRTLVLKRRSPVTEEGMNTFKKARPDVEVVLR